MTLLVGSFQVPVVRWELGVKSLSRNIIREVNGLREKFTHSLGTRVALDFEENLLLGEIGFLVYLFGFLERTTVADFLVPDVVGRRDAELGVVDRVVDEFVGEVRGSFKVFEFLKVPVKRLAPALEALHIFL